MMKGLQFVKKYVILKERKKRGSVFLYNQKDIREVLEGMVESNAELPLIKTAIKDFVDKFNANEILCDALPCDAFEKMCELLEVTYTEDYPGNNPDEAFETLYKFFDLDIDEGKKRKLIYDFIKEFVYCSDDECYCDRRVYVIVKNLSSDGDEIIKQYNDLDMAESEIEDIYNSCFYDDEYIAENVWFKLFCYIRENQYDLLKNFCTVFELDATGIEDSRKNWEDECDDDE